MKKFYHTKIKPAWPKVKEVLSVALILAVILAILVWFGGCVTSCVKYGNRPEKRTVTRYDNILAVFYHQHNWYSGFQERIDHVTEMDFSGFTTIVMDVPDDEMIFVEDTTIDGPGFQGGHHTYVIHLHNINDLSGGEWKAGKAGHGTTNKIGQ